MAAYLSRGITTRVQLRPKPLANLRLHRSYIPTIPVIFHIPNISRKIRAKDCTHLRLHLQRMRIRGSPLIPQPRRVVAQSSASGLG